MSLTSCIFNVNHQYCFFIEGNFISKDNNYYFDVKEITKDEYDSENNINVIADKVLKYKHFFKLKFYTYENTKEKIIDIINLRDSLPNTSAEPISYVDDNGIEIIPSYPGSAIFYNFHYLDEIIIFYKK